jgi:hypothetical protein
MSSIVGGAFWLPFRNGERLVPGTAHEHDPIKPLP